LLDFRRQWLVNLIQWLRQGQKGEMEALCWQGIGKGIIPCEFFKFIKET